MWKMSIQQRVLGLKLTTFSTRVSSHNHQGSRPQKYKNLVLSLFMISSRQWRRMHCVSQAAPSSNVCPVPLIPTPRRVRIALLCHARLMLQPTNELHRKRKKYHSWVWVLYDFLWGKQAAVSQPPPRLRGCFLIRLIEVCEQTISGECDSAAPTSARFVRSWNFFWWNRNRRFGVIFKVCSFEGSVRFGIILKVRKCLKQTLFGSLTQKTNRLFWQSFAASKLHIYKRDEHWMGSLAYQLYVLLCAWVEI